MVPISLLPPEMARRLPREVPAYTLARLAVAIDRQGQGAGADLLMNAMDRVREAAEAVGGYALFVDAKDKAGAGFYAKYGFVPCPSNPLMLVMMISELPRG
jgi:predicted N-acetyltransferase YhbS